MKMGWRAKVECSCGKRGTTDTFHRLREKGFSAVWVCPTCWNKRKELLKQKKEYREKGWPKVVRQAIVSDKEQAAADAIGDFLSKKFDRNE